MKTSYVVHGAELSCSMGEKNVKLKVAKSRKVRLKGLRRANVKDCKPLTNVPSFGKCKFTDEDCKPACKKWLNGKSDVLVQGKPALLKTSIATCPVGAGVIKIKDDGQSKPVTGEVNVMFGGIDEKEAHLYEEYKEANSYGKDKYFVISSTSLMVRKKASSKSKLQHKFSPGERINIVLEDHKQTRITKRDKKDKLWIQVYYKGKKTGQKKGWVAENYVLPDEPIVTLFSEKVYSKITGKFGKTKKTVDYIENWGAPGKGDYPKGEQKENGRFKVAVAPKILNPRYPNNGKIETEEFKAFNKNITVYLKNKKTGVSKEVECIVTDIKAHSFNKYPKGHPKTLKIKAYVKIPNGLIQTGIAYPKSSNAKKDLACSINHMNGSVVEFCGHEVKEFNCKDYMLVKIISNI